MSVLVINLTGTVADTDVDFCSISHNKVPVAMIDRRTIFGNPFEIGEDGTREQVIEKYREYFYDRLKADEWFKSKVHRLKGKVLGCWCKPLPCHGDVIAEYLNSLEG